MDPVVVVHGGAWAIPDALVSRSLNGVRQAAIKAWGILQSGGSAVDAVESAVTTLEDNDVFDAGTGSVLTADGTIEMDSMIMEGCNLNCGSVACVKNISNPVKLARMVMEKTGHTMFVGDGANNFAKECDMDVLPMDKLVTKEAKEALEIYKKYKNTVQSLFYDRNDTSSGLFDGHETVGCVAMDTNGLLASATSTGGITAKRPGRVGDSPLVGCGGYADNACGAVSCTGHGESITKVCLAKRIVDDCGRGEIPQKAIENGLNYMSSRVGKAGGAVCIGKDGKYGIAFTTQRMVWASISQDAALSGINPNEIIEFGGDDLMKE